MAKHAHSSMTQSETIFNIFRPFRFLKKLKRIKGGSYLTKSNDEKIKTYEGEKRRACQHIQILQTEITTLRETDIEKTSAEDKLHGRKQIDILQEETATQEAIDNEESLVIEELEGEKRRKVTILSRNLQETDNENTFAIDILKGEKRRAYEQIQKLKMDVTKEKEMNKEKTLAMEKLKGENRGVYGKIQKLKMDVTKEKEMNKEKTLAMEKLKGENRRAYEMTQLLKLDVTKEKEMNKGKTLAMERLMGENRGAYEQIQRLKIDVTKEKEMNQEKTLAMEKLKIDVTKEKEMNKEKTLAMEELKGENHGACEQIQKLKMDVTKEKEMNKEKTLAMEKLKNEMQTMKKLGNKVTKLQNENEFIHNNIHMGTTERKVPKKTVNDHLLDMQTLVINKEIDETSEQNFKEPNREVEIMITEVCLSSENVKNVDAIQRENSQHSYRDGEYTTGCKMRKEFDDTIRELYVNQYPTIMKSVGCLVSSSGIGTIFRVGRKYGMTAAHVVNGIINPHRLPTLDATRLHQDQVFVSFLESGTDASRKFKLSGSIGFLDNTLDVAVVEFCEESVKMLPPPLSLLKHNGFIPQGNVAVVGYGHNANDFKCLEHSVNVIDPEDVPVSEIQNYLDQKRPEFKSVLKRLGKDVAAVDEGYTGYKNNHHMLLNAYVGPGASGSPIFSKADPASLQVVGIYTCGYPKLSYELPSTARFRRDYTFEAGTKMAFVYDVLKSHNPALATDIFKE